MKIISSLILLFVLLSDAFAVMHKDELTYQQGDRVLKGMLVFDDAFEGKRPGVVVYPEKWGVNDFALLRAEMLAENGYVALVADIYGDGNNTRKLEEADALEASVNADAAAWSAAAIAALDTLKTQRNVNKDKVAAIGLGMGVRSALMVGLSGAQLGGIACMHGPLPEISADKAGSISAKLLFLLGSADNTTPIADFIASAGSLSDAGLEWETVVYGGAMQSFSNPYADSYGLENMSFNMEAEQKAWERVLAFLENLFEEELNI
jgi:dienelactone hydrolase